MHFFAGEPLERLVVVAFVRTACDPDYGTFHTLQCVPRGIDVGGFRVVDVGYAADLSGGFEPVFHRREVVDGAADAGRGYSGRERRERRRHSIISVVQPGNPHFGRVDLHRLPADRRGKFSVQEERIACAARHGVFGREGELLHPQVVFGQLLPDHLVVARIDEEVARILVLRNAHLGIHVVLETVVVTVEVVGRDVRQHADMGAEPEHAVELERAQLQYVPVVIAGSDRVGETLADIAAEGYVVAGVAQDLVDERRSGRLAVRAGDADRPGFAQVAARELHFGDDRNARFAEFDDHRRLVRNTGRLDDFVRRENPLFGVAPFLVGDLPLVQFGFVAVGDPPLVGEENVESFLLGEDRGAVAADAAAQDNYFFHGVIGF